MTSNSVINKRYITVGWAWRRVYKNKIHVRRFLPCPISSGDISVTLCHTDLKFKILNEICVYETFKKITIIMPLCLQIRRANALKSVDFSACPVNYTTSPERDADVPR